MRITFVLPLFPYAGPTGGYKVAYEYANHLTRRGHEVSLVHTRDYAPVEGVSRLKAKLWPRQMRMRHRPLVPWFEFDPRVTLILAPDLHSRHIPDADVVVATAWQTAEMVARYPSSKGAKHYLIYDYEYYMTASDDVRARMADTYRSGFRMISTSPSVKAMLAEVGVEPSAYIPCGLDLSTYAVEQPMDSRPHGVIGFPVRPHVFKGLPDALRTAEILREKYGEGVRFKAFGSQRPEGFPEWVKFVQYPSDRELCAFYNSLSIFLFPSHYEGWGIPGTEALACGTALVAADSVGMRDYAIDGETALVAPRQRPDLLAEAVSRLLEDEPLRLRLAQEGHERVQRYTWGNAVTEMEKLFLTASEPAHVQMVVRERLPATTEERPYVTAVIPTYNGERFIAKTIESVQAQTYRSWELVVVDDGSTDSTHDIVSDYARRDPRIRIVRQANGGIATGRNRGLAEASSCTEYIAFLDHDDVWEPDALDTLIAAAEASSGSVGAHGIACTIEPDGSPSPAGDIEEFCRNRREATDQGVLPCRGGAPTTFAVEAFRHCIFTVGQAVLRKSVLREAGGFDQQAAPCDDYDLYLRLTLRGHLAFVDKVVVWWRKHEGNTSNRAALMAEKEAFVRSRFVETAHLTPWQRQVMELGERYTYVDAVSYRLRWAWGCVAHGKLIHAAKHLRHALTGYLQLKRRTPGMNRT